MTKVPDAAWIARRRALLVAVSAHQDAALQDLYAPPGDAARLRQVLINPGRAFVSPDDVTVLENPTLGSLKEALASFCEDAAEDELLLLYFSGHALRDARGEVFLACSDTLASRAWTTALPSGLLRGILQSSPSRNQLLILDCCYAAGVMPTDRGIADAVARSVDPAADDILRAVLAASGQDQEAYERARDSPRNDHSLFTNSVISGLETGEADLDGDGMVTMKDLAAFVRSDLQRHTGGRQTPALAATPGAERLALSRAPGASGARSGPPSMSVEVPSRTDAVIRELDAPLQVLAAPIARLRSMLGDTLPVGPDGIETWLLDGIVEMLQAELAFICTGRGDRWRLLAHSSIDDGDLIVRVAAEALGRLSTSISGASGTTAGWRATAGEIETIAIPLAPRGVARWLFVVGPRMPSGLLIEPVATVCRAVCESHEGLEQASPLRVLGAAWDALRRRAGFVPHDIYRARRDAFEDQLRGVVPYFQPVLYLAPDPVIDGWEALARERDGSKTQAPLDLFQTAELWGREFMLLLDMHMLRESLLGYRAQINGRRPPGSGHPEPRALTVNVYPDTLLANEYFHQLRDLLHEGVIQPKDLALEISEKLPIPEPPPGVVWDRKPTEVFKERLGLYVSRLGVRPAIDDFGVGHGSLARLLDLSLTYVKLDQWYTEQKDEGTIGFVNGVVNAKGQGGAKVVVEGFKDRPPFTLEQAWDLNVRYVQGEFVGAAEPTLKMELSSDRVARVRQVADRAARRQDRPGTITGSHPGEPPPRIPGLNRLHMERGESNQT